MQELERFYVEGHVSKRDVYSHNGHITICPHDYTVIKSISVGNRPHNSSYQLYINNISIDRYETSSYSLMSRFMPFKTNKNMLLFGVFSRGNMLPAGPYSRIDIISQTPRQQQTMYVIEEILHHPNIHNLHISFPVYITRNVLISDISLREQITKSSTKQYVVSVSLLDNIARQTITKSSRKQDVYVSLLDHNLNVKNPDRDITDLQINGITPRRDGPNFIKRIIRPFISSHNNTTPFPIEVWYRIFIQLDDPIILLRVCKYLSYVANQHDIFVYICEKINKSYWYGIECDGTSKYDIEIQCHGCKPSMIKMVCVTENRLVLSDGILSLKYTT